MVDILLKLANRFGTEGMRHCLALAGMFRPVTRIEEPTLD